MLIKKRQTRIAIRKFIAVPVTVVAATFCSTFIAYYIETIILKTDVQYVYSVAIGFFLGTFLALSFKSILKERGQFQLDYILTGTLAVIIVVSMISFLFHMLAFGFT